MRPPLFSPSLDKMLKILRHKLLLLLVGLVLFVVLAIRHVCAIVLCVRAPWGINARYREVIMTLTSAPDSDRYVEVIDANSYYNNNMPVGDACACARPSDFSVAELGAFPPSVLWMKF